MHLSEHIDLTSATVGGLLIGLSSTALLSSLGRISGVSGMVGRCVLPCPSSSSLSSWAARHATSFSYLLGLLGSGYVYMVLHPGFEETTGRGIDLMTGKEKTASAVTVLSGLLVGFGSRLGSGCVSGHGVCGLPRLSLRSLTAVLSFMITGGMSVVLGRQLEQSGAYIPVASELLSLFQKSGEHGFLPTLLVGGGLFTLFFLKRRVGKNRSVAMAKKTDEDMCVDQVPPHAPLLEHIVHFSAAFLFGWGLCYSGMTNADKVKGFLDFSGPEGWDPSLMGVMCGAVGLNLITFRYLCKGNVYPVCKEAGSCKNLGDSICYGAHPDNLNITWRLVLGEIIFGMGWGMGGLCPGPSLVQLGTMSPLAQAYVPGIFLGMAIEELLLGQ